MTDLHPITPPTKLIAQWIKAAPGPFQEEYIAIQAARWGADQELEACINAILVHPGFENPELFVELLRTARRPKPKNLAAEALAELDLTADPNGAELSRAQVELIRCALEQFAKEP